MLQGYHDAHTEDRQEATQKAKHKLKTRLSPGGEKKNRKAMAMVATVYTVWPAMFAALRRLWA
jgi:hypothetical protein